MPQILMEGPDKTSVGDQLESTHNNVNGSYNNSRIKSTELRHRVLAFLQSEPTTDQLKRVQEQVRISIGVVEEALNKYR